MTDLKRIIGKIQDRTKALEIAVNMGNAAKKKSEGRGDGFFNELLGEMHEKYKRDLASGKIFLSALRVGLASIDEEAKVAAGRN